MTKKSGSATCPRLHPDAKTLEYDKKYKSYGARRTYFRAPVVQKGFDLTSVDPKRWAAFKKKYGLKLIKKAPTQRYGSKPHIFFSSKDCVIVVTSRVEKEGRRDLYLSYMRFEAPKDRKDLLKEMMKDFRGSRSLKGTDIEVNGKTVATYIKEEDPYAHPPKSYASFI